MNRSEHDLQCAAIAHLRGRYPDALYCATVGGMPLGEGKSAAIRMKMMKRAGYVNGVPDLIVYERRNIMNCLTMWNGLAIEFKSTGNIHRQTVQQKWWQEQLEKRGWYYALIDTEEKAIETITAYMYGNISAGKVL